MADNFICFNNECYNMKYIKKIVFNDEEKKIDIVIVNVEADRLTGSKYAIKSFTFENNEHQYNLIKNKVYGH